MPQRGAPQFGASLPHGRRRERPVGPGQFHSERRIRAGRVVPPGRCGFANGAPQRGRNCPATGFDLEPLCRMIGAGRGPSDRAKWCLPGGADLPMCAAAGAQLPGHWSRFGPLCRMVAAGRGPSDRASFIQRGESERAVWCLPGGADLPWCAAAGAQLPGHWSRFGASLPHGRCRERPVGPGQFHSERRIRAGRVVPSRAVRICHGAPQRGRNCPATGFDLEPLCRMVAIAKHWPNRRPTTKITDWN